jgi:hypothetical protein
MNAGTLSSYPNQGLLPFLCYLCFSPKTAKSFCGEIHNLIEVPHERLLRGTKWFVITTPPNWFDEMELTSSHTVELNK